MKEDLKQYKLFKIFIPNINSDNFSLQNWPKRIISLISLFMKAFDVHIGQIVILDEFNRNVKR